MGIVQRLRVAALAINSQPFLAIFSGLWQTIVVAVLYVSIFTAVLLTDKPPAVPNDTGSFNISEAWLDLRQVLFSFSHSNVSDVSQIASRPHPYNSHTNDHVRAYVLSRLYAIADKHTPDHGLPYMHVWDDRTINITFSPIWTTTEHTAVYFESTNILVKVEGTDARYSEQGAVLFSAHYDSAPAAPGVTDNGIGVVTLLQMVDFLAGKRPRRTAVFNFNNGEEDGMYGAHAYVFLFPITSSPLKLV